MAAFDMRTDTPATVIADADRLLFGDVSDDKFDTITFSNFQTAVLADVPDTTPGGSDTQVQFNDGGAFGGVTGFTWDGTRLVVASARFGVGVAVPLAQLHVQSQTGLLGSVVIDGPAGDLANPLTVRDGSQQSVVVVTPSMLRVLQPGGADGKDEVQISHDGTEAAVTNMTAGGAVVVSAPLVVAGVSGSSGAVVQGRFNGAGLSSITFNADDMHLARNAEGRSVTIGLGSSPYLGFGFGGMDVALARDSAGVVKVTDGSTGLGSLVSDLLVARQDGGTAGQDEVQISHDGTNAIIDAMSGSVDIKAAGLWGMVKASMFIDPTGESVWSAGGDLGWFAFNGGVTGFIPIGCAGLYLYGNQTARDAGLARAGAGVVSVTDGSTGGGALEFLEMTEPAAPAANAGRLFVKDNGSGKSQLCIRFASGATQVIATEP